MRFVVTLLFTSGGTSLLAGVLMVIGVGSKSPGVDVGQRRRFQIRLFSIGGALCAAGAVITAR